MEQVKLTNKQWLRKAIIVLGLAGIVCGGASCVGNFFLKSSTHHQQELLQQPRLGLNNPSYSGQVEP